VSVSKNGEFIGRFRARLTQDAPLYGIIAALFLSAAILTQLLARAYLLQAVEQYLIVWIILASTGLPPLFIGSHLWKIRKARSSNPLLSTKDPPALPTPEALAGLVLYFALAVFMGSFTTIKTLLPTLNPFWADPLLAHVDRALHFGHDPWRILHPLLGYRTVTQTIELIYEPVWSICIIAVPLFFCVTRRKPAERSRFLTAYLMIWIINGLLVAGLFTSGGPAFYGAITHDTDRFSGLVRYLDVEKQVMFSASWSQHQLWALHAAQSATTGAGISAFPSLHVSMMVLCCLGLWTVSRPLAFALTAVAGVIVVGAIHLGWHYAVDAYAGFILVPSIWWASGRLPALAGLATDRSVYRPMTGQEAAP
jgi:hypothetical protein